MAAKKEERAIKKVALNRQARHEYFIEDTIEAGLVLTGTEVKSLRAGRATIGEAHAGEMGGEIWLFNAYVPAYNHASAKMNHEARRPRKLLVRGRQRDRLLGLKQREGIALVPLSLYFNERGIAKLELGVGRGKKMFDKRETEKKRDWGRQKQRLLKAGDRSD